MTDNCTRVMELVAKIEAATADEGNAHLVVLAAVSLAGHIINCCVPSAEQERKRADIKHAIRVLHYTANMDIEAAQRQFIFQRMPTVGSIM
jgi:hypothetical protein